MRSKREHCGKDRENLRSAIPPRGGHTNVPWVPGMWYGDLGRQTMKVTNRENVTRRLKHCGKDRENPYAATPPLRGHTNVPWVPGMCNAPRRQIMWVTEQSNATTTLNDFGPGAAVLSLRGQEDISCREDRSVII